MSREMKDSGVEWIGEIPSKWKLANIGRLFSIKAGGDLDLDAYSPIKTEEHLYPVLTNKQNKDDYYGYTKNPKYAPNTITVTGRGGIGIAFYREVEYDAIIRLLVITPRNNNMCKYYQYFISSVMIFNEGNSAIPQLSAQQLAPHKVCFPSQEEQEEIVEFLDKETSRIDTIIAKTKSTIADYKLLKQSIITEAVTKGLNKDAEMKDSGVDWTGEVPKYWNMVASNSLFSNSKEKALLTDEKLSATQGYGVIPQELFEEIEGRQVVSVSKNYENLKKVHAGDFVISLRSFQGGLELSRYDGAISAAYTILRGNYSVNFEYYKYLFKSVAYVQAIQSTIIESVREGKSINYSDFRLVKIPSFSLDEQAQIATYLDGMTQKIESLINQKQKLVENMESYKKSLIYECVTGKKEIVSTKWGSNIGI